MRQKEKTRGSLFPLAPAFIRFMIIVYCALLLMQPVTIFVSTYRQTLNTILQSEISMQSTAVESSAANLDQTLTAADEYANSLLQLAAFEQYLTADGQNPSGLVSAMMRLIGSYPRLYDTGRILKDSFVYSVNSRSIISPTSGYIRLQNYYDRIFRRDDYSYGEWLSQILENAATIAFDHASESQGILYSRRIGYGTRASGRIFFNLDSKQLLVAFHALSYIEQSPVVITDPDGRIIYSRIPAGMTDEAVAGITQNLGQASGSVVDGYVLCHTVTQKHGLRILAATPYQCIVSAASQSSYRMLVNQLPLFLLNLLMIAIVILFSFPHLMATMKILTPSTEIRTMNPFRYIRQAANKLSVTSRTYEELLEQSQHELQSAALSELVFSKQNDERELTDKLARYGLTLSAPCYRGVILMLYPQNGTAPIIATKEMHAHILETINQSIPESLQYVSMANSEQYYFIALLPEAEDRFEVLKQKLRRICNRISNELGNRAVMYIGNECTQVNRIAYSFKNARKLIATTGIGDSYLVFEEQSEHERPIYHYSTDDEQIIQHYVNAGNSEAVCHYLDAVREHNMELQINSKALELQLLYAHMLHTLLNCGYYGPIKDEFRYELHDLPLDVFFGQLKQYYITLCGQIQSKILSQTADEERSILDYICTHFSDSAICLSSVSEYFGINERNLTDIIRRATDMGFAGYLEKIRMEQSMALLKGTDFTIQEISVRVGYTNDKSFRRAFKRYYGEPPSSIRSEAANEDEDE